MKKLYTLLLIILSVTCYGQKQPWEKSLRAIDSLKKHCDGENWTVKEIDELLSRTSSPLLAKGRDMSKTEFRINVFDFSNNQLKGLIPESFFYLDKSFINYHEAELKFSWNHISEFTPFFGHSSFGNPAQTIRLDHNQITVFDIDNTKDIRKKTGSYSGYSLYAGTKRLVFNNNEISSLTKDNLVNESWGTPFIANKAEEIRIDNNRLDFSSLCTVVPWIKNQYAYKSHNYVGNPNCVFTYYPQKALGEDHDAITKPSGENVKLTFSLTHAKNIYSWQLNGSDIPLSNGQNYNFNLSANNAGVYRCKITNPDLSNVTLYSKDMPVFMNKEGNKVVTDINLTHNPIRENFPRLTIIGDLAATDPDGDKVFFRLPEKQANNSCFRINEGKTLVSAEELFDRSFIEQYEIVVEAYDIYGGSFQKTLILKKDEASNNTTPLPTNITLSNKKIDENLANAAIGDLAAIGVENYSFSLPQGVRDNNLFSIDENHLKTKLGLDYEIKDTYKIRVKASAADGTSMLKDFDIVVNNVNDNPHELIITNNEIKIGQSIRSVVGYFAAVDQDENDSQFTYSLESDDAADDNELFVIENNCLKTRFLFTTENIGEKTVRVVTQDEHEGKLTSRIAINIVENTATTAITQKVLLNQQMIAENSEMGTLVGNLDVSDKAGMTFTFSLPDRDDNSSFQLNGDRLEVNSALNFEQKSIYSIFIVATVNDISINLTANIHITNVNEAPYCLGLTKMGVQGNAPEGTEVGQLVVSDPDGSDAYTFELINSDYFELKGDKVNVLTDISSLPELHEIQIKVSDEGGLNYTQKLNLNVKQIETDVVNVAPVRIGLDNFILDRNWTSGTSVATLFMKDANGDQGTFALTEGTENFSIQGDQLILTSFEDKNEYQIKVEATDGIETISQEFSLTVKQIETGVVNVAPVRIGLDNFLLDRNWTSGTPVATLFMKDANGDQGTFTLTEGTENFSIQGDQLILTSFEDKNVYQIEVEATDGIETINQEFSLFVPTIINGIDNINSSDVDASLYPNPVNDILNTTKNGQIMIYNMSGSLLKNVAIQGSIDLSDLSTGVYLVILQTAEGNKSFKIIKN